MSMKNRDVSNIKRRLVWILLSHSVLGLTGIPVRAQDTRSEEKALVISLAMIFVPRSKKGYVSKP